MWDAIITVKISLIRPCKLSCDNN